MKNTPNPSIIIKIISKISLISLILVCLLSSPKYAESKSSSPFYKGIVEGFYGKPYSHAARLDMIRFLGREGFNYYIYGPKDDAFHRHEWMRPYSGAALKKLKELIKTCKKNNIIFCFALSPGLSVKYSSSIHFKLIMSKYKQVYKLGVRHFSLFLDDIPKSLKHTVDINRFESLAKAHIYLVNKLYNALKRLDGKSFLSFVPTEYHGLKKTDYLLQIGKNINKNIPICWTGKSIVSKKITEDDLIKISSVLKRKLFIWDNYPVNDYNPSMLFMGSIRNRTTKIKDHAVIYVANPMNQPNASKIPLITIAEALSRKDYHPPMLLFKAIVKFSKLDPSSKEVNYLMHFVSLFQDTKLYRNTDSYLKKRIDEFLLCRSRRSSCKIKKEATRDFIALLEKYYYMRNVLSNIKNAAFIKEISPWLSKLRLLSRAASSAISIYLNKNATQAYYEIKKLKKKYSGINKNIGMFYLENFINSAIKYYKKQKSIPDFKITTNILSDFTYKKSLLIDNDTTTFFKSKLNIKEGDYIRIDFPNKIKLSRIKILSASSGFLRYYIKNAFLEASFDGKNFSRHASIEGREYTIHFALNISIKAIKISFPAGYNTPLVIREIIINRLN